MPDQPTFQTDTKPTLQQLIDYLVDSATRPDVLKRLEKTVGNAIAWGMTAGTGALESGGVKFIDKAGDVAESIETPLEHLFAPLLAKIVGHLLGVEVSAADVARSSSAGAPNAVGQTMADIVLRGIAGDGGPIEPGDAGARRMLSMGASLVLNSWFEGIVFDQLVDLLPGFEGVNAAAELGHELVEALGLSRLMRTALRPLVSAAVTAPLEWKVNRELRPKLLDYTVAAQQFARGRWSQDQVREELARQGYSDDRIEALLTYQAKFLSAAQAWTLVVAGQWTKDRATQHLKDHGYDSDIAETLLTLENLSDIGSFERSMADAAVTAYADGRIDDATLDTYTHGVTLDGEPGARLRELAAARRALRQQPLSLAQVEACVLAGILAVPDYRAALERAGYTVDAVDALDLLLRKKLNDKAHIEDLRKQQAAEKAAAAKAKAAAAAAKLAAADTAAAAKRTVSVSTLKAAVVKGLIPIDRFAALLSADYDPDSVQILVGLAEQDRQAYLDQQAKAQAAEQRAGVAGLNVGELKAAVFAHLLTVPEFERRLEQLGLAAGDAQLLAATVGATLADRDQAAQLRADAGTKASARHVNLSTFEQLVRRGVRTIAEYDQLLVTLGYDDASRAALEQLLQLKIADDARAAQLRAAAAAAPGAKGLTLEQLRRGVLLGVATEDAYQTFLVNAGYSADAQVVLMAELRDDEHTADAARLRREQAGAPTDARQLPLATVAQAARLGLITPDVYQQRLADAGYTSDDIAIDMELLTTEIADVQAARQARDAAPGTDARSGLTLGQLAIAVKHGARSLEDYRAALVTRGLSAADVATQVRVLGDELAGTQLVKARRDALAAAQPASVTPIAVLEGQVRAGTLTVDDYAATLEHEGLAPVDADLLAGLLADELEAAPSPG